MRKIVALTVCWFLAFSLGFTFLHPSYSSLIRWLSPVFGTSLHVLLSMVYFLLANPFTYTMLILLWASVGFIGGLIIRRRLGSVLSMLPIYTSMFSVIAVAGFRVFEQAQESNLFENPADALALLPPLPPGLSLGTILNAPVISEIYQKIMEAALSLGGSPEPSVIINILLSTIVLNMVKNIAILCIFALVGCEIGKLLEKAFRPKIAVRGKRRFELVEEKEGAEKGIVRNAKKWLSMTVLLCLTLSMIIIQASTPLLARVGTAGASSYYSETLVGTVTSDGTVYLEGFFVDSAMSLSGIDLSHSAFSGASAAVLISQHTAAATLPNVKMLFELLLPDAGVPSGIMENLTEYFGLIPSTMFITLYLDVDPDTARQRADAAASLFSSAFGTSLTHLISFNQTGGDEEFGPTFTFLAYQADTPLATTMDPIMSCLNITRGGLAELIWLAHQNGIFVPGETETSANGTVMFAGFLCPSEILDLIGVVLLQLVLPNMTEPVGIMGLGSYWLDKLHSSSFTHGFSITELLGVIGPIAFSSYADMSTVMLLAPNATVTDSVMEPSEPILRLITTAPITDPQFAPILKAIQSITKSIQLQEVNTGATLTPEDLTVTFVAVLPLKLRVEKTLSLSEVDAGQEIKVMIKIVNDDEDPAQNVRLDDTRSLSFYQRAASARLVQGNLTEEWTQIEGNSSVTYNYTIALDREGIYTLPSAVVTYDYMNRTFRTRSNYAYAEVRSPLVFQVLAVGIPYAWGVVVRALNMISGVQGQGSMVLTVILVVVVGLIAFKEYRNARKWFKERARLKES